MRAIRVFFLVYGLALATFFPFVAVILDDRGFAPAAIGVVTAVASLVFAASVPGWGHLADVRLGRSGALRVAALLSGLALVAFGLPWPPVLLAALYLCWAGTESAIGPLADAVAVNALEDPERQYPPIRLLTSLGFAAAAVAVGFLYDVAGYGPASLLYALGAVLLAVIAGGIPDRPRAELARYGARRGRGGSFRVAFAVQPRLPLVLLAILLVHVGVLGGFTFLGLRLVELGGGPSAVALSVGLSAVAEIPGMLVAGRLVPRIGIRTLFVACALVYALCVLSWAILADPLWIVLTRIPSGLAFAGIWITAVLTMQRLLPDRLQGTGQGLYQTTAFGLAAILANLVGGFVIQAAGTMPFFAVASVATAASAIVGWVAMPRRREPRPEWPDAFGQATPGTEAREDATR